MSLPNKSTTDEPSISLEDCTYTKCYWYISRNCNSILYSSFIVFIIYRLIYCWVVVALCVLSWVGIGIWSRYRYSVSGYNFT